MVNPVPEGCNTVNVYLVVKSAEEAMAFYSRALGARPGFRMAGPNGRGTMHAEMHIGNSTIMLSDENPQWELKSPQTLGGSPASLHLYVDDADALFNQAIEAGCTPLAPMSDMFWGDRYGKVLDPFGYQWGIATHKEELTPHELEERATAFWASMSEGDAPSE